MPPSAPSKNKEVMILLYSANAKLRNILAAGLRQCSYSIIETESDRMTTVKANQYRPSLTIIDLGNNPDTLKIISGLLKSNRTKNTPLVLIGSAAMNSTWQKVLAKLKFAFGQSIEDQILFAVFPFKFAALLRPINELLQADALPFTTGPTGDEVDEDIEEQLFDPELSNQKKLDIISKSLKKQWAFPFTVFKALKIANSESSGCRDLGKCIKTDSAASSAILKVSNTIFYAKSSGKFQDVIQAVVRLGFRETRNLLSSMALINLAGGPDKNYGFSRTDFWMHSLSTGVIAENLCKRACDDIADLAFITALVHDLGKIPLDNNFTEVLPKLLEKATSDLVPFNHAEKSLLGFSHADCGRFLMDSWNFPEAISLGVFNHHNTQSILGTRRKEERIMQGCVYAANLFSKALALGHSTDECLPQIPQQILNDIKIPDGPSEEFFVKIMRELEILVEYLKIADDNFKFDTSFPKIKETHNVAVIADQKAFFHPILIALKHTGHKLHQYREATPDVTIEEPVLIHFPKKGEPFEVTLEDEEKSSGDEEQQLEIFMIEDPPETPDDFDETGEKTLYLSSEYSDFRIIQRVLDNYFDDTLEDSEAEKRKKKLEEAKKAGEAENIQDDNDEADNDDELDDDEDLFQD